MGDQVVVEVVCKLALVQWKSSVLYFNEGNLILGEWTEKKKKEKSTNVASH